MRFLSCYDQVCLIAYCLILYLHLVLSPNHVAFASTEAEALLQWKASILNQTLNNLTSWSYLPSNTKENASPCFWAGISCNTAGSVRRITLPVLVYKLGTLREFSFLSFPNLEYLDLSMNKLFDAIPPQISFLSKLVYLHLSFNQLNGSIPTSLGNMTNLTNLYLGVNELSGTIPKYIGNLKSLLALGLSDNQLSGSIPTILGDLTSLTCKEKGYGRDGVKRGK
ncbi:putative transferase [Rosa chinensis]|uniref:Putative transferase n=1 Tax=Rosa chinensis TaxID=74649 RepID=A0A2P6PHS1_ROSCH|nr:putative transferase [Rosa chinensis]